MTREVSTPVDLVALGIVAPSSIELPFETLKETFVTIKSKGRADVRNSSTVKVVPLSPNQARVEHGVGSDTTLWAGVGLPTYGRYFCEFKELGTTETVAGDMRGKDGVAAYRLTLGTDALPTVHKVEGFSSAGVHHVNVGGDSWMYRQPAAADHAPGLDPFVLEYWPKADAEGRLLDNVTLRVYNKTFVEISTKGEIPRLCFKNGKITMRFEPPPAAFMAAKAITKEPVYTSYAEAMAAAAVAAASKGVPESKEGK
jgi:hypothetical protein